MKIRTSTLQMLRDKYTVGSRVELVQMDDPYSKLKLGAKGIVTGVDDIGTIHVHWENGSTLGILYGVDKCLKIEQ